MPDINVQSLRIPPHSIEAEQSVLGGLMLANRAWDDIASILIEDDFYNRNHRLIYRAIAQLAAEEKPFDVLTLTEWLKDRQELENVGGFIYVATIEKDTPSAANIIAYANIVRNKSILRQLIAAGTEIANSAYVAEEQNIKTILDEAESKVFKIAEQSASQKETLLPIKSVLKSTLEHIKTMSLLEGSIIGLSTGYTELDEKTSGLQKGDLIIVAGRPSMGKCILQGSKILNPKTGALEIIDDIVAKKQGCLATLDENLKFVETNPNDFIDDGFKPVFKVTTALGKEITTTMTHPFLTLTGWEKLEKIKVNDFVGVPRILPFFGQKEIAQEKVKLLAYLIADGCLTRNTPSFTNKNKKIREDYINALHIFPDVKWKCNDSNGTRVPSITISKKRHIVTSLKLNFAKMLKQRMKVLNFTLQSLADLIGVAQATVYYWTKGKSVPNSISIVTKLSKQLQLTKAELFPYGWNACRISAPNSVTRWLKKLKLMGKSSHHKCVPNLIFKLKKELVILFLNRLFSCDGSVYIQNKNQVGLSYATVNYELAQDVQHLLLRFGILAKLRKRQVKYKNEYRPFFELLITHQQSIRIFLNDIGIFSKEKGIKKAKELSYSKRDKNNLDLLPISIWDFIIKEKKDITWAELARRMGRKKNHNFHVSKRRVGRKLLLEIAEALNSDELKILSQSDLYWDKVISIKYQGKQQVYDLSVPIAHNFVAEDFLVHNTSLAMNIAEHVALNNEKPVVVFSMEMPSEQLMLRLLSSNSRVPLNQIRTGQVQESNWPRLVTSMKRFAKTQIFIDDAGNQSPTDIRAKSRRLAREHGQLGLIVIDYLQLMSTGSKTENRATEIAEISRSIKSLAKELSVPIMALSQLNRSLEQRPNKRPIMSDLRESGSLEQDADLIIFIYRDEVYNPDSPEKGISEIIIGKQRNGPIGTVRLTFTGKYTRFDNYSPEVYNTENMG